MLPTPCCSSPTIRIPANGSLGCRSPLTCASIAEASAGTTANAALPEGSSRRGVEPLCAYYSMACVPAIERRLDANDMRVVAFFDDVRVQRLPERDVRRFGDPAVLFMNV